MERKKSVWEQILEESETCLCNRNKEQHNLNIKTQHKNRLATIKEQERYLVDLCCNPKKINLMKLREILQNYTMLKR